MNKDGERFDYLIHNFPCMSEAKIKEGIFVGPQMEQRFQDASSKNELNAVKKIFEKVCKKIVCEPESLKKLQRNCGRIYFLHSGHWGLVCL